LCAVSPRLTEHCVHPDGRWIIGKKRAFPPFKSFRSGYSGELSKAASNDFISVPIKKTFRGDRKCPSRHKVIRVKTLASSSAEHDFRGNDEKDYCIDDLMWSGDFDFYFCHLLLTCRCDRPSAKAGY